MTRFFSVERGISSLHFWAGPCGVHLFWFDVWKSRLDWCNHWRETP